MASPYLLLACFPLACWGQAIELGAKAGLPLTQSESAAGGPFTSATRRYTVGPMLRIGLPRGFGLEFDALYQRVGWNSDYYAGRFTFVYTHTVANSWEFPVLGTYRFLRRLPVKPYASAGPAFRIVQARSLSADQSSGSGSFPIAPPTGDPLLDARSHYGVAFGAGVQARAGFLRISPEFRYTRWASDSPENADLHSNRNQVEIFVSLGFRIQ